MVIAVIIIIIIMTVTLKVTLALIIWQLITLYVDFNKYIQRSISVVAFSQFTVAYKNQLLTIAAYC